MWRHAASEKHGLYFGEFCNVSYKLFLKRPWISGYQETFNFSFKNINIIIIIPFIVFRLLVGTKIVEILFILVLLHEEKNCSRWFGLHKSKQETMALEIRFLLENYFAKYIEWLENHKYGIKTYYHKQCALFMYSDNRNGCLSQDTAGKWQKLISGQYSGIVHHSCVYSGIGVATVS